ncbi:MAG TPA: S9 family peptidase [Gammaproteobacteria bacterium]|nr:S9 family peptidase [Gammaproteobacteria bacterium]
MRTPFVVGSLLLAIWSFAAAQPPPLEAFASLPAMQSPSISPDGKRLAFIAQDGDKSFVLVADIETRAVGAAVDVSVMKPRNVIWTNDDTLLLLASETIGFVRRRVESVAPYGIDLAKDLNIRQLLLEQAKTQTRGGGGGTIGGYVFVQGAQLVGFQRSTGLVLMPRFEVDGSRVLYAIDAKNDARHLLDKGTRFTADWVVDETGAPKFRLEYTQKRDTLTILRRDKEGWRTLSIGTVEIPEFSLVGLDADGRLIVMQRSGEGGRFALYVMSGETGEIVSPFYTHPTLDVASVRTDPYTNRVIGAEVAGGQVVWFDTELKARQADLDEVFRGESPTILSWSRDRVRWIVATDRPDHVPAFYVLDTKAGTAKEIASTNAVLDRAKLPQRVAYSYRARDGVEIPAYLTRPLGVTGPAPLVLLPHGGPAARDVSGYDWLAHALASRGYVVLQPNFRGSAGYGEQWEDAGHGQWGVGVMQHDLTDGVAAVVAAGIADPERVCIVGASYGGYAALAGAAFTPELYRCAVAIAGVADLRDMLGFERDRAGTESATVSYWREAMGVTSADSPVDRLNAASPAQHAQAVRAAVLLIHGRDDTVVPITQSRTMERALTSAGKSVQFVELDGEDHWLSRPKTRLATLQAVDAFLAEHLAH